MNIKHLTFCLPAFIAILLLTPSCEPENEDKGEFENGAFIVNEGAFGNSNASISFYSYAGDAVTNDIFKTVNERDLGDVAQSLTLHDGKAYIVVNNSNKIEITDRYSFVGAGVIPDMPSPRYMVASGNKGYVSCWGDNSVKVIDLNSNTVSGSISTGSGPEKMLIHNDKLYVTNTGGWGTDSVLTVIDLASEKVVSSLVLRYSPSDIVLGKEGNIWVLSAGKVVYGAEDPYPIIEETPANIYKINPETDEILASYELFDTQHPSNLEVDNEGNLFVGGSYGFQGVYRWDVLTGSTQMNQIITDFAYGFNINSETNEIYIFEAPNFTDAGIFKRYSTEGTLLGTYSCGIGPNSAAFKRAQR